MVQQEAATNRILKAVRRFPGCELHDLVLTCPELNWKQIFLEVVRLSRTRQLRVTLKGPATYIFTAEGIMKHRKRR
jgi:hypothetical protein